MPAPDARTLLSAALARRARDTSDHDLNPGTILPAGRILRPAAVLIGFQETDRGAFLILTKRASHLKHHPGQIAFPGGKVDAGDADAMAAALREAHEEIGLEAGQVQPLGTLDPHETVTGFSVTPVLAMIDPAFRPARQEEEVEEVFRVPFAFITDPANFRIEGRMWRGIYRRYFTVPYGPYYIWGATARILKALADRMAE